jgi:iron(III) transport system ATP-binding protein
MAFVRIENLVKCFGRMRALDRVSVDIRRGEIFFLLGPSGCGKTTLLRSIAGFYVPDEGRIFFGEQDVTHLAPQKRDTGMVFQSYALWPHMTVAANVAFGLDVRGVPGDERRRRVAEALDLVHMGALAQRKPVQLSGGQQQRVALARALVIRPQCLLLDEPLSNLDAKLRLEMRTEIRRICKDAGLTAIYVTHDQKEALSIADRMAVMFGGRIAQVGAPGELYRRPASAAVADFLGETNILEGEIGARDGVQLGVRTALGTLWSSAGGSSADAGNGRCRISIRPEAILLEDRQSLLTSPESERLNRFTGHVRDCIYLGEAEQLELEIAGLMLRATIPQRAALRMLKPGDSVACSVDPRDVVLLPAGEP